MTLAVIRVPRGSRTTRKGEAYIVPEASHHRITPISRPGSVPVVEHWVMAVSLLHNKYRYDFVSQPPQTRTCASNASGSSGKAFCYPYRSALRGGDTIGELKVSLVGQPTARSARRRLPSRGSLGSHFPTFNGTMRRYDCPLPFSGGFACRSLPDTLSASSVCVPRGSSRGEKAPTRRQGSWSAGTPLLPALVTRRQLALSSSRITPVSACPALRPRWCPKHLAWRLRDCCLPGAANRRLSLLASSRGYPPRTTTILISGLDHAACTLATPGSAPPFTGTHAGSLLTWCHPLVRSDLSRSPRDSPTGSR